MQKVQTVMPYSAIKTFVARSKRLNYFQQILQIAIKELIDEDLAQLLYVIDQHFFGNVGYPTVTDFDAIFLSEYVKRVEDDEEYEERSRLNDDIHRLFNPKKGKTP